MQIFIDESGNFVASEEAHKVSCVAALVVPDVNCERLLEQFQRLEGKWGGADETKGSKLDESQIAAVIDLVREHEGILDVEAADMAIQADAVTTAFKNDQAERLVRNITESTPAAIAAELRTQRDSLLALANQLFVQAMLTIEVIERVVQNATLYWVLRRPDELGRFAWFVDAKDIQPTRYEKLWRELILPFVQGRSRTQPFSTLEGADYSAFSPFLVADDAMPPQLRIYSRGDGGVNHRLILEELRLVDSKVAPGVRIADVLASAFCRALNGKLGVAGWGQLGSLMIAERPRSVHLVQLRPPGQPLRTAALPYLDALGRLESGARSLFP